ncbi:MAG: hypothetical protein U0414_35360 [Polyangiaceae bacterium]
MPPGRSGSRTPACRAWLVTALALLAGCDPAASGAGSTSGDASASTAAVSAASSAEAASSAAPEGQRSRPFTPDVEVVKLVKAIASGCDVDEARASVRACRSREDEALARYIQEKSPDALYATAAYLALGEGAKDKRLFAAAVHTFNRLPSDLGFLKKNATPEAADRVAKLLPAIGGGMSAYFARGGAAVMLLAGARAELTALLTGSTVDKSVARKMWSYYLAYGGVDALDDLRAALKSEDRGVRASAAIAPSAALAAGSALSEGDRARVCDFAKEALATGDDETLAAAADSLAECGGAYSDAALDALAKRADGPKASSGLVESAYHQCWTHGVVGGKVNGSKSQCERALAVLERITEAADLDASTLGTALWAVGTTGRNGGPDAVRRSKAILAKFVRHKDKGVQEKAKADYTK